MAIATQNITVGTNIFSDRYAQMYSACETIVIPPSRTLFLAFFIILFLTNRIVCVTIFYHEPLTVSTSIASARLPFGGKCVILYFV